jgi:glycosyltransferase involved in cell wall biosynthesis
MITARHESDESGGLRVLQLTAPAEFGGLETVVRELSAGLVQRGHVVCVGCVLDESVQPASHPLVRELESCGVSVEVIQVPPRAYRQEKAQISELIRRFDADVVHTHGYHCDVIGGKAARDLGVARVATVHGFTGGGWKNRAYEVLQRRSYRKADAVIAVSRLLADRLSADRIVASHLRVIRNALARRVDWPTREDSRDELGIEGSRVIVGWVGRLSLEKGPDIIVRSMADARAADLTLCMVGDGPL